MVQLTKWTCFVMGCFLQNKEEHYLKFAELGLSEPIMKAIERAGFEEATPIQGETIPLALAGKDVIGQAQTGTGKTAAFGLPILQNLDLDNPNIQALIISPTRELAIQTQEELYRLGRDRKAKVQVVYGGADIRRQIRSLKEHPQILVGTPGRLLDHINRRTVKLDHVKTLVLDEADEMLDMGFVDDIESIIKQVPDQRQTLLFSATLPAPIMKIGKSFMTNPEMIKVKSKELTADLIDQYYVRAKDFEKFDIMTRLFDVQSPELTLIFGRTKRRVDELTRGLKARGYNAEGIHGDLSQQKRMSVLKSFKSGRLDILVATDVAARGLDISGVTHVYNYDIPQDPDSYVHRIGRTGRAGKSGVSVTFVTPNEMEYLHIIENLTKKRMLPLQPPTEKEAFKGQLAAAVADINSMIEKGQLAKFSEEAEELLKQFSDIELASVLLKTISKESVPVKITPERPLPSHKKGGNRSGNRNGGGNRRGGNGGGYRGGNRRGNGDGKRRGGDNKDGRRNSGNGDSSKRRSNDNRDNRKKTDGRSKRNFTIRTNDK
ncbi:DEAD-box ATP-dependent RNA helicase CshA [Latilactobacillus graminis DSM 20719]|uniref:DEAD-box ATP-dependent RNA helicase CshA n=2 Tax=Latilactobacillus graminis TaxID=60519 RepID=A0AA89I2E6_9LACO|nr:DEAD-box ATP-dependent RNA helicase CshA [Latilactobacillus graminis DSM 20719]